LIISDVGAIPIPGIDTVQLNRFLSNNQFFGILNIFSGGGLSNLSVIMLGVGPYITGSIIMQLLTIMVPSLKKIYHEEGEAGRKICAIWPIAHCALGGHSRFQLALYFGKAKYFN